MNAIYLLPVIAVVLAAPLGTTILGWVAVSQILRSEGKLRGLGLALFDVLFFPLLVINALMVTASMRLGEEVMDAIGIEGSRSGWLLLTVMALIIFDIVIVRWAWRETLHRGIRGLLRVVMITALIIAAIASLYVSLPLYLRHVRINDRAAKDAELSQARNTNDDGQHWQPGIYSATRQEEGVVLRVVLLAEKKLQFYAGERLLPVFWAQADAPTDVFVAVREGGLAVGSGMVSLAEPLHLGEVVFSEVFPDLKAGVDDIVLGTVDGNIPFGVRLIPTTAAEASAIENHEPVRGAAPVALPTPENVPEQTARVFMEAIRDGDMAAAVALMDPKMKAREEYSLHLELASKSLRDEVYADHLDRLTQFTETVDTTLDGTTRMVTIRIAAPSGEWESAYPYGLALILVSTPDGWRVAHFDGSAPGESLSDFTKTFTGGRSDSRPGITQIDLLDVDAHKGPVVLDLASGELLEVPKEVESQNDFASHFNRLGKGDLAWDGVIVTLRGARLSEWLDDGWTLRNPEEELDGAGGYRLTVPSRLRITTAEGGHYIVDVREKIENEKGVRIEYQPSTPPEPGKNTPEAARPPEIKSPPEGAEIRNFVLDLPVQPPTALPKDSPLSIQQVKAVLKGVTWGELLHALGNDRQGDITVAPLPSAHGDRYEIAFPYRTGRMRMELSVDWKFRSAEPSRLCPVGMPDKVLAEASEFLPQLAIRYAMLSGHDAAAPAVEEARAQARQFQDSKTLKQYALALTIYGEDMGSYPPDLAFFFRLDFPGKKRWEGLLKDGLMHNHQTGKMERPIYHGYEDLRANGHDVARYILLAAPSADPQGKRLVAHLDGSVNIIDEEDYQKQIQKQAKAPGQAAIPNSGIRVVGRTAAEWIINYTSDGKQSLSHWTGTRENAGYLIIPEGSGTAKLKATREGLVLETGSQRVGPIPLDAFSFAKGNVIVESDGSVIVGKCSDGVVGIRIAEVPPTPDGAIAPGQDVRISATPEGMWLDDRKVSHEELAEALKQLHPDTKILIQADPSLRHKEMVIIMETCRKAGLVHIAVASKKNPEKEHPDQ